MYCRKCGREIPDHSVMCGYCGTPTNPDNPYTYGGTPRNMDEGANGLGIASMILGIVAILLACCAGGKWLTFLVDSCRSDSWNYRITEAKVRQQQKEWLLRV